ncbi:MAG: hypothetical protein STHCBS139747_002260 [Sporothrix thermara]
MAFGFNYRNVAMLREVTPRLFLVYMFMSIGAINFGFDNGWWGTLIALPQFINRFGVLDEKTGTYSLPSSWQSAGSGTGNAGMAIGCIIASPLISRIGRKNTVLVILTIALIGMVIQNAVPNYWGIMVGRMINAISMGLEANNIPIFMSELSPPAIRGSLVNFYQWWQIVGVIFSRIIVLRSNIMWPVEANNQWAWRLVMVIQMVIPLLLLGIYWILPESPNWLLSHGRRDDAKAALMYIRKDSASEDEVDQELALIEASVAEQQEFHRATTYWDCFKGSNGRRTMIACGVQFFEQLSGNAFASSYSVIFMAEVGITNLFQSNMARSCMSLAGATLGFYLPDKIGRRWLLMSTAVFMWASMWVTSGIVAWLPGGVTGGLSQFMLFLQLFWAFLSTGGWGSVVWIITAESGTAQLREKTVSIATTVSFIAVLLVSYINPFIQGAPSNLGGKVGFIYGSFSFIAIFFVYFFVPEMKGRSLEELDELFQNGVPARHFASYKATGIGAQITDVQNANADPLAHLNEKGVVTEGIEVAEPVNTTAEIKD